MKIVLAILLGILALNVLVVLAIVGILVADHFKARRRERRNEAAQT
ncbi:MAG: hypothetical protein R3B81_18790 [bacterium]|nr:hypothetical protein [Gemmatimonadota bacterium]